MITIFGSSIFTGVTFLEKLLFTKHLATMVNAGITLPEALSVLIKQTKSIYFKKVLTEILQSIENGKSLAKSLLKHKHEFDELYVSLVSVGEESGTLEKNLEFLAKQLGKDYSLRNKIRGSLMYPTLVFTASLTMGGFIALFILPKLVDFYSAFDLELPLTTKLLLFFALLMRNWGVLIVIGFICAFILGYTIIQLPQVKPKWHALILKLPLLGELLAYAQIARFCRNLGVLLQSGVSVTKSLEVTASTLSNLKFRHDLLAVSTSLSRGKNIGETLSLDTYSEYPQLVSKMISISEKTGKLDETLMYLGDFYEEEIDTISKNLATVVEPILLLTVGLIVGFVALAVISPIYELTGSIRK